MHNIAQTVSVAEIVAKSEGLLLAYILPTLPLKGWGTLLKARAGFAQRMYFDGNPILQKEPPLGLFDIVLFPNHADQRMCSISTMGW